MPVMRVRLLFFAILRDIAGTGERELQLASGATARDVWEMLRAEYPRLHEVKDPPMAARNESYIDVDAELHDGDELAFIPPVAGG
jgi:molybdopterin converting factor subunit 1